MNEDVLARIIADYQPENPMMQELALAEILQQVVLGGLSRAGLFRVAAFHGGSFLRIVHQVPRFSEDLDFVLKTPKPDFGWERYLAPVVRDCQAEGIVFEVIDKSQLDSAVRKAFLKTDSVGKLLVASLPHSRLPGRKIKIKLEVDANPPAGSNYETHYLNFPTLCAITTQTLECSFASKSHALLCRSYTKGRDWFDFLWYVSRGVRPNLVLLGHALDQHGPWAGQGPVITPNIYLARLDQVIQTTDWELAVRDVERFLRPRDQAALGLWNVGLFTYHLDRLSALIAG